MTNPIVWNKILTALRSKYELKLNLNLIEKKHFALKKFWMEDKEQITKKSTKMAMKILTEKLFEYFGMYVGCYVWRMSHDVTFLPSWYLLIESK